MTATGLLFLFGSLGLALWARVRSPRTPLLLLIWLIYAVSTEVTAIIITHNGHQNTWVYNIFLLVETTLWTIFAHRSIPAIRKNGSALMVLALVCVSWLIEVRSDGFFQWANTTFMIAALALCILFVIGLLHLTEATDRRLWRMPEFWSFLSVVGFFGAMIPYNGLMNYLYDRDKDLTQKLYVINEVLLCLRYGLMGMAFGCYAQRVP